MIPSYNETKILIGKVLTSPPQQARAILRKALMEKGYHEGGFYAGIVEHGLWMKLSPNEWFDLLSKIPNRILRSQLPLTKILSQEQLNKLPPETG